MKLRINDLSAALDDDSTLEELVARRLSIDVGRLGSIELIRKAIDARRRNGAPIRFNYIVDVEVLAADKKFLKMRGVVMAPERVSVGEKLPRGTTPKALGRLDDGSKAPSGTTPKDLDRLDGGSKAPRGTTPTALDRLDGGSKAPRGTTPTALDRLDGDSLTPRGTTPTALGRNDGGSTHPRGTTPTALDQLDEGSLSPRDATPTARDRLDEGLLTPRDAAPTDHERLDGGSKAPRGTTPTDHDRLDEGSKAPRDATSTDLGQLDGGSTPPRGTTPTAHERFDEGSKAPLDATPTALDRLDGGALSPRGTTLTTLARSDGSLPPRGTTPTALDRLEEGSQTPRDATPKALGRLDGGSQTPRDATPKALGRLDGGSQTPRDATPTALDRHDDGDSKSPRDAAPTDLDRLDGGSLPPRGTTPTAHERLDGGSQAPRDATPKDLARHDGGSTHPRDSVPTALDRHDGGSTHSRDAAPTALGRNDGGSKTPRDATPTALARFDGGSKAPRDATPTALGRNDGGSKTPRDATPTNLGRNDGGSLSPRDATPTAFNRLDDGSQTPRGTTPTDLDRTESRTPTPNNFIRFRSLNRRPIVIGFGPAGMFAALTLARAGLNPIVFERGSDVDTRARDVEIFFNGGELNPESNVQFGEGGAGTFSDGKLTTRIDDPLTRDVIETFIDAGAPLEIAYLQKPHIGTDNLRAVVKKIRSMILALGGEIFFDARLTDIELEGGRITAAIINGEQRFATDRLFLAIGHSARDTYELLLRRGVTLEPKPFAIGVRIEHPQELIDRAQFGVDFDNPKLPRADYFLTYKDGARGAYTFCMCPGGEVIAAATELGVVTNGMSQYARASGVANSAVLATVGLSDFDGVDALSGVRFQRRWEQLAFELGGRNYRAPVQTVGDFLSGRRGSVEFLTAPTYPRGWSAVDLHECLPSSVSTTLERALVAFERKIAGFAGSDVVLTGVETRTSAPCRIVRDRVRFESVSVRGLYPIGEGSGYSGGIMSSAVDGMKAALIEIKRSTAEAPIN